MSPAPRAVSYTHLYTKTGCQYGDLHWGVAVDNSLDTKVKITVLATGFGVEDVPGMDTLHGFEIAFVCIEGVIIHHIKHYSDSRLM